MKNLFQVSLFFMLTLVAFSCKNKAADATVADAAAVSTAAGADYTVDVATSKVMWEGSKPAGTHNGFINLTNGTVKVENGEVTGGNFTLDMNTITVLDLKGDEKAGLEGHLKGATKENEDHFFNVAKYPTATFEITKVGGLENNPDANKLIYGNLTMKGQTKEVGFPAKVTVSETGVQVTAPKFTLDRTQWGVNYASKSLFDDLKDKFVNDEIALSINLAAAK